MQEIIEINQHPVNQLFVRKLLPHIVHVSYHSVVFRYITYCCSHTYILHAVTKFHLFIFKRNNQDVLFGRGKPFQNHNGNRKMLGLIDQYKRQYNESPRDQKRPIVEEIIGILSNDGGRFLRRYNEDVNSTWWTEVPRQVAFDKVSHAFRSRGRPKAYPKTSHSVAATSAINKGAYLTPQPAAVALHPQQHMQQQQMMQQQQQPQYQHHQGQYIVDQHGSHQYVQYPGMPNYNPVMAAAAASMQQPHAAMMGYHPMQMSPQQQAMMQAGMMVVMQQHAVPPPGTSPTAVYGQAQPPLQQPPYHHHQQQPVVQFGTAPPVNPYYGQQQPQQQQQQQGNIPGGYPNQAVPTAQVYRGGGYAQPGAPAAPIPTTTATEGGAGQSTSSEGKGPPEGEGAPNPTEQTAEGVPKSENETKGDVDVGTTEILV